MKLTASLFLMVWLLCFLTLPPLSSAAAPSRDRTQELIAELAQLRGELAAGRDFFLKYHWSKIAPPDYSEPVFLKTIWFKAILPPLLAGAGPEERAAAEKLYRVLDQLVEAEDVFLKDKRQSRACLTQGLLIQISLREPLWTIRLKADELALGRKEFSIRELRPTENGRAGAKPQAKSELIEIEAEPPTGDLETLRLAYKVQRAIAGIERILEDLFTAGRLAPGENEFNLFDQPLRPEFFLKDSLQDLRNLPNLSDQEKNYLDRDLPVLLGRLAENNRRTYSQLKALDKSRAELDEAVSAGLNLADELLAKIRTRADGDGG